MNDLQHRVAGIAVQAAAGYGFVIAGGYAIALHGVGNRPSEDVDLFTNRLDADAFAAAVTAVCDALAALGDVAAEMRGEAFARITVTLPNGEAATIDMGVDFRQQPPATLAIGPVLSLDDAAGSKLAALYGRGYPRDYLDVHALQSSGRYTRHELLILADQREATPLDRRILASQLRQVTTIKPHRFQPYGVDRATIRAMVAELTAWADELDGTTQPTS